MAAYLCQAGEVVLQDEAGEEAREVVYVEGVGAVWAVEVGAWGEEVGATVVVVVTAVTVVIVLVAEWGEGRRGDMCM